MWVTQMMNKLFESTCPNVLHWNFKSNLLNKQKFSSVSSFPLALREFHPLQWFSDLHIFAKVNSNGHQLCFADKHLFFFLISSTLVSFEESHLFQRQHFFLKRNISKPRVCVWSNLDNYNRLFFWIQALEWYYIRMG